MERVVIIKKYIHVEFKSGINSETAAIQFVKLTNISAGFLLG
jgi:glycerol-3-phosphate responsive antiterminator